METLINELKQTWDNPAMLLVTALRVVVVYGVLLIFLQLSGRRVLGQMTPFDLLTLLLLSNVVQNAMLGSDNSLVGGLVGAMVLLLLNRLISRARAIRERFEGSPTVLISQGQILLDNLKRENVSQAELMTALREHGVENAAEVGIALLEADGTISVVPHKSGVIRQVRHVKSSRNR